MMINCTPWNSAVTFEKLRVQKQAHSKKFLKFKEWFTIAIFKIYKFIILVTLHGMTALTCMSNLKQ